MPSVNCPGIAGDAFVDCTKPMSAGVKDAYLYLFNYSDLESVTEDGSNPNLLTDITLVSGKKIYRYEGKNNSIEPRSALNKQRYAEVWDHEVIFKIFDNTADIKEQLDFLKSTKVIAIVENNYAGTDSATSFEIYGLRAGLELTVSERIVNDQETQGAYNLTLASGEFAKEPYLPATLWDTDYATTKAILAAYFTA
jgi:hypothetical protein